MRTETFNAIGNGYIPDIFSSDTAFLPVVHKLTLLLGIVFIIFYIISEINRRRQKQAYNFEVLAMNLFILKLVLVTIVLGGITWVLAGYNGLPTPLGAAGLPRRRPSAPPAPHAAP